MRIFITCILLLCWSVASYAAPCYGTKMPQKKGIFIGEQTHYLWKRYLEHEAGKLRSGQEFLLVSYGVFDWLSVDLKGGAGFIRQHPAGHDELDYPSFMGGGYGFRIKVFGEKNIKAVCGFQHISIHPHSIHLGDIKHKAVLDDWQLSGLVSYDCKIFTPYLGGKWSRVDYIHWTNGERDRVKSDLTKSVGVVFGLDIPLTRQIWLNLEGQAIDGEAAALSLNYSF